MKCIMDVMHCCRKCELVCLKTNALDYFEGTKVLPIELF